MLFAILLFQFTSCNSQEECRFCDTRQQGAVYQNIQCKADTSVRYNLYVPSGTGSKNVPVLILLDPHGNTAPALKKYTDLAEKYHVILAGFNASSNDIAFEKIFQSFTPWLGELYSKAPVDSTKIFIAGFSGGARVATLIENKMPEVNAVALCGAGPADIQAWSQSSKPAMMFVGSRDFNYFEVTSLYNNQTVKRPRSLSVFAGRHDWPPAETFEDFFVLIDRLSNGKVTSVNENDFLKRSKIFLEIQRPDFALYSASSALFALGEMSNLKLQNFADSLQKNFPEEFVAEMNANSKMEVLMQNRIGAMFQNADTLKYFALIDSLNNEIKTDSVSLHSDVLFRIKAWCGIAAYSFSNQAKKMNVPFYFSILRMYEYTEPANPDMLILISAYYASSGQCMKARIYLNNAKRNGFKDQNKLNSMKEFDNCEDIRN